MIKGQEEESEKPWMRLYLSQDQVNKEAKLGGSVEGEIYSDNQTSLDKSLRAERNASCGGRCFLEMWAETNQTIHNCRSYIQGLVLRRL